MRLFRVIVPVPDIDAAASFYGELLGDPGERVSSGRHYFDCGGTILACYDSMADGDQVVVGANPDHVYLATEEPVDVVVDRALAAGASWGGRAGIAVRPWGERSAYLRDPFGNKVCIVEAGTEYTGGPFPGP